MTNVDYLIARLDEGAKPIIIYDAGGNSTRKVLADDALRLQRLVREAAAALREQQATITKLKEWRVLDKDAAIECLTEERERRSRAEAERDAALRMVRQADDAKVRAETERDAATSARAAKGSP